MSASDTKDLFQRVEHQHEELTYPQALDILSDLAYLVIPFDKTQRGFQLLLTRLRILLQNQTGNVKMCKLIEAITRLNIDTFNTLIRQKVSEGNYSRSPADICAILYFFATQHKMSQ